MLLKKSWPTASGTQGHRPKRRRRRAMWVSQEGEAQPIL